MNKKIYVNTNSEGMGSPELTYITNVIYPILLTYSQNNELIRNSKVECEPDPEWQYFYPFLQRWLKELNCIKEEYICFKDYSAAMKEGGIETRRIYRQVAIKEEKAKANINDLVVGESNWPEKAKARIEAKASAQPVKEGEKSTLEEIRDGKLITFNIAGEKYLVDAERDFKPGYQGICVYANGDGFGNLKLWLAPYIPMSSGAKYYLLAASKSPLFEDLPTIEEWHEEYNRQSNPITPPASKEVKSAEEKYPHLKKLSIDYYQTKELQSCVSEFLSTTDAGYEDIEQAFRCGANFGLHHAAQHQQSEGMVDFQGRVLPWLLECFGEAIASDKKERNYRFIEEALELVQSTGCTKDEVLKIVDYVFNRDIGEPYQEVGGVMVTLAALCLANKLNMHDNAETELARIWTKVDKIRAKQVTKDVFGVTSNPPINPKR